MIDSSLFIYYPKKLTEEEEIKVKIQLKEFNEQNQELLKQIFQQFKPVISLSKEVL
jgi:hypothetical protein